MEEFPKCGNTQQEQLFGYKLSSARMVVECAFGRLKSRFSILRKPIDINVASFPETVCFILHNFCEMNNECIADITQIVAESYDNEFQPQFANSDSNESDG